MQLFYIDSSSSGLKRLRFFFMSEFCNYFVILRSQNLDNNKVFSRVLQNIILYRIILSYFAYCMGNRIWGWNRQELKRNYRTPILFLSG